MVARVFSSSLMGIEPYLVEVEVHAEFHSFRYATVGLPEAAVRESEKRVISAIRTSGYHFPPRHYTINLAPADIKKDGSAFDLPIAIGILEALGDIRTDELDDWTLLGELALDGTLRPIRGALPAALGARDNGKRGVILPVQNAREAAVAEGVEVIPVDRLSAAAEFLNGTLSIPSLEIDRAALFHSARHYPVDFQEVRGQQHVKRGLEVAAAGGHNVLMIGPPGSGKTMLAKRFPTILPELTLTEALETTKIHSVTRLVLKAGIAANRAIQCSHHTIRR